MRVGHLRDRVLLPVISYNAKHATTRWHRHKQTLALGTNATKACTWLPTPSARLIVRLNYNRRQDSAVGEEFRLSRLQCELLTFSDASASLKHRACRHCQKWREATTVSWGSGIGKRRPVVRILPATTKACRITNGHVSKGVYSIPEANADLIVICSQGLYLHAVKTTGAEQ